MHKTQPLQQVWISPESEYSSLSDKAVKTLMIFWTTCLCEKSFLALSVVIKTEYQIDVSEALRFSETPVLQLRLSRVLLMTQQHISYWSY